MTPTDVVREMRESDINDARIDIWAAALEAAMREPVAYLTRNQIDGGRTEEPLYALPPDAAGEIERLERKLALRGDALNTRDEDVARLRNRLKWFEDSGGVAVHAEVFKRGAEIERLKATVSNLERVAMRVHNFPSHPGGHKDDRSGEAMVPEDWRHGWICAVEAMQAVVNHSLTTENKP